MGVGAGFYMYDVILKKFPFVFHLLISSCLSFYPPDNHNNSHVVCWRGDGL